MAGKESQTKYPTGYAYQPKVGPPGQQGAVYLGNAIKGLLFPLPRGMASPARTGEGARREGFLYTSHKSYWSH